MPVAAISVHGVPRACRFSLHGASRPKSGATPSMASLVAACTRYLLNSDGVSEVCVGLGVRNTRRLDHVPSRSRFKIINATNLKAPHMLNKYFRESVVSVAMDGVAPKLNLGGFDGRTLTPKYDTR